MDQITPQHSKVKKEGTKPLKSLNHYPPTKWPAKWSLLPLISSFFFFLLHLFISLLPWSKNLHWSLELQAHFLRTKVLAWRNKDHYGKRSFHSRLGAPFLSTSQALGVKSSMDSQASKLKVEVSSSI